MYQQIQLYHQLVVGAIDTILIKTGSGGTNGTHTGVAIRGDGSSGECSVVAGGAVTAVTVTTELVQVILLHMLEMQT